MTDQAKLVEELRSSAMLPLCPYDQRSPDYWTTPDDEPCKVCGQINDDKAPILCRGADTTLFNKAADLLASKDRELKASEIMRNLLSANLERRTEALVAAEALTLSLRAENERLRGALRTISNGTEDRAPPFRAIGPSQMAGIARAALSQSTGDTK